MILYLLCKGRGQRSVAQNPTRQAVRPAKTGYIIPTIFGTLCWAALSWAYSVRIIIIKTTLKCKPQFDIPRIAQFTCVRIESDTNIINK